MRCEHSSEADAISVTVESMIPQADLFARAQPAIQEGPARAWEIGRTLIDFGAAILGTRGQLRSEHRIRDAVLIALLRRALITVEAVYDLLAQGLEEPAHALGRTLLDIELSIKLIHQDATDAMAHRLAAFHYYAYQQHGQDMLSDRDTREGTLAKAERAPEIVDVAKSYARLLESPAFDDVRDDVKKAQYWHGFAGTEEAFRAIDQAADFFMTYDIANWFVHDVNVDFDYVPSEGDEAFHLKALAQRDPRVIQLHLEHALLRFHAILSTYVKERGLPDDPQFKVETTVKFPDGHAEQVDAMDGVTALLLSQFSPPAAGHR